MPQNIPSLSDTSFFFKCLYKNTKRIAILVMDTDGCILHANKAFCIFFGYPDEYIIGKHLRVLFTKEDQQKNLPEIELLTVKNRGNASDNNYVVHKDGSRVWVSGESILVSNKGEDFYIVKIFQNIHNQKLLEKGLRKTNLLVENILDHIYDLLIVVDSKMRILKANQSFLTLCQLKRGDLTDVGLTDLIQADTGSRFYQMLSTIFMLDVPLRDKEVELRIADGEHRIYLFNAVLIGGDIQDEKKILLTLHDITFKKHTEQQREDLLGLIIHELRNPLANVTIFTELLRECILKDNKVEAEEYLNKVKINLKRLNNIIGEMYDVTKAGAGHLKIEKTFFLFDDMIREALDTVKTIYPSHRIDMQGTVDEIIYADKYRLIQVLTNYLSNAIKYSPGRDLVIVKVKQELNNIVVSVTDFGEGISTDKIPYLFNKYYRDKKSSKTEGVGLGLYLSKEIIRAHRGEVWAESMEGKGSTFYFSLPHQSNTQ